MRIVSVLPSATEIVCALGARTVLVGRSADCDYPVDVQSIPVVMRPRRVDSELPSAEIDARVRASRGQGESLYELDVAQLRDLRPDVLLTQDLCGVCSVTGAEVEEACAQAGVAPSVISLIPRTLDEVWDSVQTVGQAIGLPQEGAELSRRLRVRSARSPGPNPPRVAVVEWLDPPILAGLWTPQMIEAAGGEPVATVTGAPGERTLWTALAELHPDLLVLSPCSFPVDRTERELADSALRAEVTRVAAPLGTFIADEAYFSRPGPRLADGVELLRHLISQEEWVPPMPVSPLRAMGVAA